MSIKGFGSSVRPIKSSEKEEMDSQIKLKDEEVDRSSLTNVLGSANSEDQPPAVGEDEPVASNDGQGLLSLPITRALSRPPLCHDVSEIIAFLLFGENRSKPSGYRPENYLPKEDEENRREWAKQQRESFQKVADRHPEIMLLFQESEKLRSSTVKAKDDPHTFLKLRQNAILCKVLGGSDWVGAFTRSFSGNESSEGPWESFDELQDNIAFQKALQNFIDFLKDHIAAEEEKEARAEHSWTRAPSGRICDKHLDEWVNGSAISPEMAFLNLQSLLGKAKIQEKLNNQSVDFTSVWITTPCPISSLERNRPGHPRSGFECKPDNPRQDTDGEGKLKWKADGTPKYKTYEQPVADQNDGQKVTFGASFMRVPDFVHYRKIGQWCEEETYWQRVKDDVEASLWVTEGGKKACSIMSVLEGKYPAIALIGVWGWVKPQTDEEKAAQNPKELRPELTRIKWKGRKVFICFDTDKWDPTKTVGKAELAMAQVLTRLGAVVRLINLASEDAIARRKKIGYTKEGKVGIDDHRVAMDEGSDCDDELQRLMDESDEYKAPKVIDLKTTTCTMETELFQSTDGEAYATFPYRKLMVTELVKSEAYRDYLTETRGPQEENAAKRPALIKGLINDHSAQAKRQGAIYPVCNRVALHRGVIYHDLDRDDGQVVKVTSEGWRVVPPQECPVRFTRNQAMLPLPIPETGGSLADIRSVVNMKDSQLCLALMWASFALYPKNSHPIMNVKGGQGRGKTSATKFFTGLVDPRLSDCLMMPKTVHDLQVTAARRYILPLDNVSSLSGDQSDALCQISTGASIEKRKLHTDGEVASLTVLRPVWLNGIPDVCSRSDLLSRTIITELALIPEDRRLTDGALNQKIALMKPYIMGMLYDSAVQALASRETVKVDRLPRMADFYKWAVCAQGAFGFPEGTFEREFHAQAEENELAPLEASPVAQVLIKWMDGWPELKKDKWDGFIGDLLETLDNHRGMGSPPRGWPETPHALGRQLTRLTEDLAKVGVIIEKLPRTKKGWPLKILLSPVLEEVSDKSMA